MTCGPTSDIFVAPLAFALEMIRFRRLRLGFRLGLGGTKAFEAHPMTCRLIAQIYATAFALATLALALEMIRFRRLRLGFRLGLGGKKAFEANPMTCRLIAHIYATAFALATLAFPCLFPCLDFGGRTLPLVALPHLGSNDLTRIYMCIGTGCSSLCL
jgi:hypothetical protein